jgi:glycosyltransferase involved in cell wall biosynthesis
LHTWNRVSWGRKPWGASFESSFPRVDLPPDHWKMRILWRQVVSRRCRFIIGISDFAIRYFRHHTPTEHRSAVEAKLYRIYPAQELLTTAGSYTPPKANEPLRAVFVGTDFFRKGGEALLDLIEELADDLDVHWTVVSRVSDEDWGSWWLASPGRVDEVRHRLSRHPRVSWERHLAPGQVALLMGTAHIGLLPTLSDTFGYSALEFLAHGIPLVGTNVQALPEVVDEEVGAQVHVQLDDTRYWIGHQSQGEELRARYNEATETIRISLRRILTGFREDPATLEQRSAAALRRIEERFSPAIRQPELLEVYRRSLGDGMQSPPSG